MQTDVSFRDIREFLREMLGNRDLWLIVLALVALDSLVGVRSVRPGGQIILLEHMRAENPLLGRLMDWFNPLVVRIMGANINRRTVDNVQRAGLKLDRWTICRPAASSS